MLGKLPDHIEHALEGEGVLRLCRRGRPHRVAPTVRMSTPAYENLSYHGLARLRGGPERGIVCGHRPPAEQGLPFLADRLLQYDLAGAALICVARQVNHAGAVCARLRQRNALLSADSLQEVVRHLEEDAGAVTRVGLTAACTPVPQVDQDGERMAQDSIRAPAVNVGDEPDAACRVLAARIV